MDKGKWITINGQHIFVEEGQSVMDAYIKSKGGKKAKIKDDKKKTDDKANTPKKENTDEVAKDSDTKVDKEMFNEKGKGKNNDIETKTDDEPKEENKFHIDDPYILFGEEHDTGIPTKEQLVKYYRGKGQKEKNDSYIVNANRLADEYLEYREKRSAGEVAYEPSKPKQSKAKAETSKEVKTEVKLDDDEGSAKRYIGTKEERKAQHVDFPKNPTRENLIAYYKERGRKMGNETYIKYAEALAENYLKYLGK